MAEDFSRGFDDLKDDFERHSQDSGLGLFIRRALLYVLGIEFALSLLASLRYARKIAPAAMWVECSVLLASCLVCYLMATGRVDLKISRLAQSNFPPVLISLGIALRLGWVMVMPPVQLSDAKDYMTLAQTLLQTGTYVDLETGHRLLAFRAPGYPAFLAAAMRALSATTPGCRPQPTSYCSSAPLYCWHRLRRRWGANMVSLLHYCCLPCGRQIYSPRARPVLSRFPCFC